MPNPPLSSTGLFKKTKLLVLFHLHRPPAALERLVFFQHTVASDSATVGQQLLDLKYKNDLSSSGPGRWMSRHQKALFGACMILGPWISDRLPHVTARFRNSPHSQKVRTAALFKACLHQSAKTTVLWANAPDLIWTLGTFFFKKRRALTVRTGKPFVAKTPVGCGKKRRNFRISKLKKTANEEILLVVSD